MGNSFKVLCYLPELVSVQSSRGQTWSPGAALLLPAESREVTQSLFPKGPQKGACLGFRGFGFYPNSIYFGLKVVPLKVPWGQSIY